MAARKIIIATDNNKSIEFLTNYFSDTESIPTIIRSQADLEHLNQLRIDFIFVDSHWVNKTFVNQIRALKEKQPPLKCLVLGHAEEAARIADAEIECPIDEKVFRRILLSKIAFPPKIKLLLVDDEAEILEVVEDYFSVRTDPPFEVRTAMNGLEGFKLVEQDEPHCMVLDLKMPVRSGVDLYRDLRRGGRKIPTIIFIDSTTAEDILEIRKWGTPVFVEKGGPYSSMPDMLALVKKLVAFC